MKGQMTGATCPYCTDILWVSTYDMKLDDHCVTVHNMRRAPVKPKKETSGKGNRRTQRSH